MGDNIISHNLHDDQEHHRNPSSSFEFFRGGLIDYSEDKMMAHAEDIIFHGKLVPINQQLHHKKPLVRDNRSLGYKKLKRSSSEKSERVVEPEISSDRKKSSSLRHVLLFGLVNVPQQEMDIRDLKNRQVRLTTSSKMHVGSWESVDVVPVSRSVDHRKSSWRVLELLSCKSPSSVAVMTPSGYMAKV